MKPDALDGALSPPLVVRGNELVWQPSPSHLVWRRRLHHRGPPEAGVVTSIVRYDAGARFRAHEHPEGEEIFVLEGVFSDERGDFPAGTFMLNPEGFRHAPFSETGCVLFVKLRQYPGLDRPTVCIDTRAGAWVERGRGVHSLPLYASASHGEELHLTELRAGTRVPDVALPRGEEIFVLEGEFRDEHGSYPEGSWLRYPPGSRHSPSSPAGCLLYVRSPVSGLD